METRRCDILVVGAGPAGASAARAAAARGLEVLMVERRDRVGVPVQCAEFIPAPLLGEMVLADDIVEQSVREMRTVLPSGDLVVMRSPGLMIRRDLFDQSLARAAEEEGARLLASTRALRLEGGEVVIRRKGAAHEERIATGVIVGADGPHSTVGRWIGSENRNLIRAAQWRVPLAAPMEATEVYFHEDFYGGYGWLFPVGREANAGIGRKRRRTSDEAIGRILERFVLRLAKDGKVDPQPLSTTGGWIPAEPVRKVTRGNVLLAGDAAGHTHPVTGAGVSQAVIGGRLAGEWAARAVEAGDSGLLDGYEGEWRERFGRVQARAYSRRKSFEEGWDHLETAVRTSWIAFREYYADS